MSARRRAPRGCCSASAAPTTAWTSRRAACSIPANRFEVLECTRRARRRRRQGAGHAAGAHRRARRAGAACARLAPAASRSCADELYAEVTRAAPYAGLTRADFDAVVDFVATGGYALKAYERFAKIRQGKDGRWRVTHPMIAQRYRMNVGTIVEADMLKVRLVRSRASQDDPARRAAARRGRGIFHRDADARRHLRVRRRNPALRGDGRGRGLCLARRPSEDPKVPSYEGGKFPLSTYLADRVRKIIADPAAMAARCREQVREWLEIQQWRSLLPGPRDLLVETFPRADKYYLVCYPFEGRLAHQTLGMLLTRRLERARLRPLGFVANEYALAIWGLGDVGAAHRARRAVARGAVRRGHAGRRPRSLARGIRADEAHLPHLRDHRRADRAPLSRARRSRAARSRSRPISSTTCCASTSPTTCCCARRAPMLRPGCSTSAGSAKCSRASRAESSISRSTMSRRWRCR